ncbi:MAG: hypothetical protein JWQ66_1677 [Mucilaginibacter sp.]|nr:hypothetical protein [Mucilaginibacter sp.]
MKTIKLQLYEFEELSAEAKEKAVREHRDFNLIPRWWDFVYDDFVTLCSYLGITVDKDTMSFDGFYSQGDGSGFNADVDIVRLKNSIENGAWKAYAPNENFNFLPHGIDRRVMALIEKGGISYSPGSSIVEGAILSLPTWAVIPQTAPVSIIISTVKSMLWKNG